MGFHLLSLTTSDKLLILGLIVLVYVGIRFISYMSTRGKSGTEIPPGTPRNYSLTGGAICPKCHRPFRLDFLAFKLGFGTKFARCEFCGKWSLVKRLSTDELRAAEQAELAGSLSGQAAIARGETDKLDNLLDESRFTDRT